MKTIILTGFEKFGDYAANPTEIITQQLHGQDLSGCRINSIVYSCTVADAGRGRDLLNKARELAADGIICLGLASEKIGLCVESRTKNWINNPKYCAPEVNGTAIDLDRPYGSVYDLDLSHWNLPQFKERCLERGIPVMEVSQDAGGYCCNQLLYQLEHARRQGQGLVTPPIVFIHIPCSEETVRDLEAFRSSGKTLLPIEKVIEGIRTLLEVASL